jgi:glycine hydroxymethyltransferase
VFPYWNASYHHCGLVEEDMDAIVDLIDRVIMDHTNEEVIEQVANEVNEMMSERAILFLK